MSLIKSNGGGLGGSGSPGGALGSFYSYTIDQSLRFDNAGNDYLNKTFSTAQTNTNKITASFWFKISTVSTTRMIFLHARNGGGGEIKLNSSKIYANLFDTGYDGFFNNALIRDPSAWYHLVYQGDSTLSTASDRNKVYLNGVQLTNNASSYTPQNTDTYFLRNGLTSNIGRNTDNAAHDMDGYMAELHVIDGSIVAHTEFGETKDGVWIPKEYSGSYGTNGFYLPFGQDTSSGSSFFFNRSSPSQVTFTNSSHYDIGSGDDFTLEAFIRPTSTIMSNYCLLLGHYAGPSGPYMCLQFSPVNNQFYFYTGNGAGYQFDYTSGDIVAGQWHHIAINRNSGNLRFFIDGTQKDNTLTSNTQAWDNNQFDINIAGNDSSYSGSLYSFDGHISNVRLVVGSAVYSDAASLTVPTATLTNVTNTKLLALTTSTFTQDASSNNVTGTVTGSSHFSSDLSPFASFNFFSDTSGNTNDFTANNLATSDVVPDSPTNNFATWNPLDKYNYNAPTEGALRALTAGNNGTQNSTFAVSSGKWYWEARNQSAQSGSMVRLIGIAKENTNLSTIPYNNSDCYLYYGGDGNKYNGGSQGSYGDAFGSDGDIVGVAFDADNGAIWFSKNGTWQNSATASEIAAGTTTNAAFTGISGTYVMMVSKTGGSSSNDGHHANFGQDSTFSGQITAGGNSDSQGIGDFKYAPPSGFLALCTSNLPDITIGPGQSSQADDHFNTVLYTGNGTGQSITGVGFQPDWVWLKTRSVGYQHSLYDSVRGAQYRLASDQTAAEVDNSSANLQSFDADGFTVGTLINDNQNSVTYVGWNWKAGGAAVSNSNGSITSSVSASTKAGFSIVGYTGTGANATVGHGLSSAPELIIVKRRDNGSGATSWKTGSSLLTSWTYRLKLNDTNDQNSESDVFNDTAPTNTVFSLGTDVMVNGSGGTFISYCFHSVPGYSKVGSYVGNGNADGTFVFTGFRPAWVMIKKITATGNWILIDAERSAFNLADDRLIPNSTSTEAESNGIDMLSNGFKTRSTDAQTSTSGATFIYLAFAEAPFKFANAR